MRRANADKLVPELAEVQQIVNDSYDHHDQSCGHEILVDLAFRKVKLPSCQQKQ